MGKSGRHKKLNRQEKAKTHLKGGVKKLGKAANIVNPTLRVKKIVIREQLLSSSGPGGGGDTNITDTAITRRHQTLQEILSSLHHHNTNLRKDALAGLLELVVVHPIVLTMNLDKILERVAALTSDLEGVIRKDVVKVAGAIFSRVGENEVGPFWGLLLTHLQCTLTHLNSRVRYSTLPFFHLLLEHFPNLSASSGVSILTSLLGLISSYSLSGGSGGSGGSDPGKRAPNSTHLKVEISGRKDEVEERLKVFALIDAILQLRRQKWITGAKINDVKRELSFLSQTDNNRGRILDLDISVGEISSSNRPFGGEEVLKNENLVGLVDSFGYDYSIIKSGRNNSSSMPLSEVLGLGFGYTNSNANANSSSHFGDDGNQFWPRFAKSCLSCLTETWIESSPSASGSSMDLASTNLEPGSKRGRDRKPDSHTEFLEDRSPKKSYGGGCGGAASSVNLNPASVDTLKNLVSVMVQIVAPYKVNVEDGDQKSSNELIDIIRETRGSDLKKHFFSHLPYVSIHESNKESLTTVNLELFLLAAQLRLLDGQLMSRLEILIDELIEGGTLNSEQCELILRFLSCSDPVASDLRKRHVKKRKCSLSTDFISCVLSSKNHRREICKYLQRVLRPENTNAEEMFLVQSLEWDVITPKLLSSFSRISFKWLNLLTSIVIRQLSSDVKYQLLNKIGWFQVQLLDCPPPPAVWNECVRLFWYADALSEFKEAFEEKLPENVSEIVSSLEECYSMS